MRGTGGGKNWVLLWWARPCSVKLSSNHLLMGGVVHPPWYFFDLRLPSSQVYGLYGLHQEGPSQTSAAHARIPVVSLCWTTPPQETLQPQQIVLVWSPVESLLLSSKSCCMQGFICALQDWILCFPQSCGSHVIKSHWPSRSNSLGSPSPFVGSPGWKLDMGFRTFTTVGELLWCYCSPVYLVGMEFDFIMIVPLLPSHYGFFFVFGCGVSFLVGPSILLLMVVQELVVILMFLKEEMSMCPSTPPSWTGSLNYYFLSIGLYEFFTYFYTNPSYLSFIIFQIYVLSVPFLFKIVFEVPTKEIVQGIDKMPLNWKEDIKL